MKSKKATYSEYFFGFKRSRVVGGPKMQVKPMGDRMIGVMLVFETIMPYLKGKLQQFF